MGSIVVAVIAEEESIAIKAYVINFLFV